jgi:capsular polysaccharide biosynthesis protein
MSFLNQVKMFSNCNTLVSNHGAGLTNLIWMKRSSKIIEIRQSKRNLNPFFVLSCMLKMNYNYYLSNFLSHNNYSVDLNDFFKKFRNI